MRRYFWHPPDIRYNIYLRKWLHRAQIIFLREKSDIFISCSKNILSELKRMHTKLIAIIKRSSIIKFICIIYSIHARYDDGCSLLLNSSFLKKPRVMFQMKWLLCERIQVTRDNLTFVQFSYPRNLPKLFLCNPIEYITLKYSKPVNCIWIPDFYVLCITTKLDIKWNNKVSAQCPYFALNNISTEVRWILYAIQ